MEGNSSKWYEIFKEKSWWKTLLSTKPVLAFCIILVPIALIIWWIYSRGKKDNEAKQLEEIKFTPATPVTASQDADFKKWVASRLDTLELDLFNKLQSWYSGGWDMSEILLEVSSLDDRRLITLNNLYQKKRKRSLRNDLYDKTLSWVAPPSADNHRDSIVKRLEGFGGI